MSNFQPLEVVGRSSETQLQVAENLNRFHSRTRVNPLAVSMSDILTTDRDSMAEFLHYGWIRQYCLRYGYDIGGAMQHAYCIYVLETSLRCPAYVTAMTHILDARPLYPIVLMFTSAMLCL